MELDCLSLLVVSQEAQTKSSLTISHRTTHQKTSWMERPEKIETSADSRMGFCRMGVVCPSRTDCPSSNMLLKYAPQSGPLKAGKKGEHELATKPPNYNLSNKPLISVSPSFSGATHHRTAVTLRNSVSSFIPRIWI